MLRLASGRQDPGPVDDDNMETTNIARQAKNPKARVDYPSRLTEQLALIDDSIFHQGNEFGMSNLAGN